MRYLPVLAFALAALFVMSASVVTFASAAPAPARMAAAADTGADREPSPVATIVDVPVPGGLADADGDAQALVREIGPALAPALAPALPRIPTPEPTSAVAAARRPVFSVPTLMYHYISDVPATQANDRLALDLRVPASVFEQHLAYLRAQGYTSVSAPLLWEAVNGRATLPAKPVLLTFDDGYADAYTNALRLLTKYGFGGTFFVTVNLIGRPGYLTWEQVRALDAAGMDVESHAMDHRPMTSFTMSGLAYQMGQSRAELAKQLGHEVRFFAYPSGDYNATAMQGAANFGYFAAFAKSGGALQSTDWAFALRRSRVNGSATVDMLKVSLAR